MKLIHFERNTRVRRGHGEHSPDIAVGVEYFEFRFRGFRLAVLQIGHGHARHMIRIVVGSQASRHADLRTRLNGMTCSLCDAAADLGFERNIFIIIIGRARLKILDRQRIHGALCADRKRNDREQTDDHQQ